MPDVIAVYIPEFAFFSGGENIYHADRVRMETGNVADDGQKEISVSTTVIDGPRISELMSCFIRTKRTRQVFYLLTVHKEAVHEQILSGVIGNSESTEDD